MKTTETSPDHLERLTEIAVHLDWLESFDAAAATPEQLAQHLEGRRHVLARLGELHADCSPVRRAA
jgi:hypothetical protein